MKKTISLIISICFVFSSCAKETLKLDRLQNECKTIVPDIDDDLVKSYTEETSVQSEQDYDLENVHAPSQAPLFTDSSNSISESLTVLTSTPFPSQEPVSDIINSSSQLFAISASSSPVCNYAPVYTESSSIDSTVTYKTKKGLKRKAVIAITVIAVATIIGTVSCCLLRSNSDDRIAVGIDAQFVSLRQRAMSCIVLPLKRMFAQFISQRPQNPFDEDLETVRMIHDNLIKLSNDNEPNVNDVCNNVILLYDNHHILDLSQELTEKLFDIFVAGINSKCSCNMKLFNAE
jgi:hypothetical protein